MSDVIVNINANPANASAKPPIYDAITAKLLVGAPVHIERTATFTNKTAQITVTEAEMLGVGSINSTITITDSNGKSVSEQVTLREDVVILESAKPHLTSHVDNETLTSGLLKLVYNAGLDAPANRKFDIHGSSTPQTTSEVFSNNLFDSSSIGTAKSYEHPVPTNGDTIYLRIRYSDNNWTDTSTTIADGRYVDYTLIEHTSLTGTTDDGAVVQTPAWAGGYEQSLLQYANGAARNVTGGAGKPLAVVTNFDGSGSGSMRAAFAGGAKYVRFADDMTGTIDLGSSGFPNGGDLTIDGRGANISLATNSSSTALHFTGNNPRNNVVIANMKFDDAKSGVRIMDGSSLFWLTHCTFTKVTDDPIVLGNGPGTDLTVDWCRFDTGASGVKGILVGQDNTADNDGLLTVHSNWFSGGQRAPNVRSAFADVYNNYIQYTAEGIVADQGAEVIAEYNVVISESANNKDKALVSGDPHNQNSTAPGNMYINGNWLEGGANTGGANSYPAFSARFTLPYSRTLVTDRALVESRAKTYSGWQDV